MQIHAYTYVGAIQLYIASVSTHTRGVMVSHSLRMRTALGSNPSASMHVCLPTGATSHFEHVHTYTHTCTHACANWRRLRLSRHSTESVSWASLNPGFCEVPHKSWRSPPWIENLTGSNILKSRSVVCTLAANWFGVSVVSQELFTIWACAYLKGLDMHKYTCTAWVSLPEWLRG